LTGKQSLTYIRIMVAIRNRQQDVFTAISHGARRQMLDLLSDSERSVIEIVAYFDMQRPAVSQHLRILLDAGLVAERRHGRERRYRLVPERLAPLRDWLANYNRFWDDRLLRLRQHLSKKSAK
jgi:DNA-binding transcriptional ArsR family regulator